MATKAKPKPPDPVTIAQAAATGDRRQTLEAMRAKLAADMDDAPPAVVAQIAGRLSAVMVEIDELGGKQVSSVDDLTAKRDARFAASGIPVAPRRETRQRRG